MDIKIASKRQLQAFEKDYDENQEVNAFLARKRILKKFPENRLKNITLEEYAIGHGTESFSALMEAKSRAWANIQGANSFKFGVYYGKTKNDKEKKYRSSNKFGKAKDQAFIEIKESLLNLIKDGKSKNYTAIDNNRLSQMFKAKILSVYFPESYINICSGDRLKIIAKKIGIKTNLPLSEIQNILVRIKKNDPLTEKWSNPKFSRFLYIKYLSDDFSKTKSKPKEKQESKNHKTVNFDDILEERRRIGKLAENFAMEWERARLESIGCADLISKIEDVTEKPAHGYDFKSFSCKGKRRFIEVKSLGLNKGAHRFFLSENEHRVSKNDVHKGEYYFYLVLFHNGEPCEVISKNASAVYNQCEMHPCAYEVFVEIAKN